MISKKTYLAVYFFILIKNCLAQLPGCTDPMAINYNPAATINDGSCNYSENVVYPDATFDISDLVPETSGLILWNNNIWTHNDNFDINLYAIDPSEGTILRNIPLSGTTNKDWEEISQDNDFIYIGDFGNNSNGSRTDLKILRVLKSSVTINPLKIDTINFSYSDQTDFTPAGSNYTDFDCEAFIITSDSIYLFTKQWISQKTTIYSLPKTPGTYPAKKRATCDVRGLITGSTYLQSKKLIVLCGYSTFLEPFLYLFYDFTNFDFLNGNKRKISIPLSFHQIEGITTTDGLTYYLSNERFTYSSLLTVPQKFHILNLRSFLQNYIDLISSAIEKDIMNNGYTVFPSLVKNAIRVKRIGYNTPENYSVIDFAGRMLMSGILYYEEELIDISRLASGLYVLRIGKKDYHYFKVIKE